MEASSTAICWGGKTKSTTPAAIAVLGMLSNLADWSWQKVMPVAALMALSPTVPSDAVPDRITPIELAPISWASDVKNTSIGLCASRATLGVNTSVRPDNAIVILGGMTYTWF